MFSKTQLDDFPMPSIYSMQGAYLIFLVSGQIKTFTKKIVHQPDLNTLFTLNNLPVMLETFFALGGQFARKKPRLMSVNIEYQSPRDELRSRQRGNHIVFQQERKGIGYVSPT